jgi:hypothetical protein
MKPSMEQQQLSIDANQIHEGYALGERYHLGELQGEYYVTYTRADVRRYRFQVFLIVVLALFMLVMIAYFTFIIFYLNGSSNRAFSAYFIPTLINPFIILINPFIMLYGNSQRRKWGNRPVITPRNRHLRVYVYEDGMVKQTNQKSEVIYWSDLYLIQYEPLQPVDLRKPSTTARKMAGIKLVLRDKRRVTINGALHNLDSLAQQLNSQDPTKWGHIVPKPHF